MAVDHFTKQQFEAALPPTIVPLGMDKGEYVYLLPLKDHFAGIFIRSSIDRTGMSAESGGDSIRCWIVNANNARNGDHRPLGGKISKYVTRRPGWAQRLWNKENKTGVLFELANMARKIGPCPSCGKQLVPFVSTKDNANKGRAFLSCPKNSQGCGYFRWLDEEAPAPTTAPETVKLVPVTLLVPEQEVDMVMKLEAIAKYIDRSAHRTPPTTPSLKGVEVVTYASEYPLPTVCPDCDGNVKRIVASGKTKPENKGRPFCTCQGGGDSNRAEGDGCGFFRWLDEPPPGDAQE